MTRRQGNTRSWPRWLLLALTLALAAPRTASADEVSEAARAAAKEKFARGVERLRAKDYGGAAVELESAHALAPYPVVLYNLGLAYEGLDRPVDALRVMKQVLAAPGNLRDERIARARRAVSELGKRVGSLALTIGESGADVRIDGTSVGTSPLPEPRALSAGAHFVEVHKVGFVPFRQEVVIVGEQSTALTVTLEPSELALAQVWIRTELPDAEVWLDGQRIAVTPLRQSIPVLAGPHAIELRRAGYHAAIERIEVGPGATAEVKLSLAVNEPAVAQSGGKLVLTSSALDDLVLTIDGQRHGLYTGPIALAPGRHDVRVERAGFFPATLRVELATGETLTQAVVMDPTPETIAAHNADVTLYGALGWTFTATAALAIGGGIAFTVFNEQSARDEEDAFFPLLEPGQPCDRTMSPSDNCRRLATEVDTARALVTSRRPVSYALFIGGGALLATGVVLLVLAPDPEAFTTKTDGLDELALSPIFAPSPHGGVLGLSGRF